MRRKIARYFVEASPFLEVKIVERGIRTSLNLTSQNSTKDEHPFVPLKRLALLGPYRPMVRSHNQDTLNI